MGIIKLFSGKSRLYFIILIIVSVINGGANVGMLVMINMILRGQNFNHIVDDRLLFLLLLMGTVLSSIFLQNYLVKETNSLIYRFESRFVNKLRNCAFLDFESVGKDAIYSVIGDIKILGRFPKAIISFFKSSLTIILTIVYLFYISVWGAAILCFIILILISVYLIRTKQIESDLVEIRNLQDEYYSYLSGFLDGFKQMKMRPKRSDNLFNEYVVNNRQLSKKLSISYSRKSTILEILSTYFWYFLLGLIIVVFPAMLSFRLQDITPFVTTILFLISPVSQLLVFFQVYSTVNVYYLKLVDIESRLTKTEEYIKYPKVKEIFENISFKDIEFSYPRAAETDFEIIIDDFEIKKGEVLFITGGNGSGKSTFLNILCGILTPDNGRILLNGKEVDLQRFRAFTKGISVIFSNHFLIKYNIDDFDFLNSEVNEYINKLSINDVFTFDFKTNTFNTNLSSGQKKRVAMLLSMLEGNEVMFFDEFASEQDIQNKAYFYNEWLQYLKSRDKTIVVVTHDHQYFDKADRVVNLENGKISDYKII
jgi:ABC-type siderophore export system fused ATPase/permease subunit